MKGGSPIRRRNSFDFSHTIYNFKLKINEEVFKLRYFLIFYLRLRKYEEYDGAHLTILKSLIVCYKIM